MSESESLMVLSGWDITIPPSAEQARQEVLNAMAAADLEGEIPQNGLGQGIAGEIAAVMSNVKTWMAEVERVSKALREPYFDHAKKIKATSDVFLMPVAERLAKLGQKLAEFEAEKKRVEIELERQRRAEAERLRREEEERQRQAEAERRRQEQAERDRIELLERDAKKASSEAQRKRLEDEAAEERKRQDEAQTARDNQRLAEQQQLAAIDTGGVRYDAPQTQGVSVKVAYEFEIQDPVALLKWCWDRKPAWINVPRLLESFYKRDITEYLNSATDRNIPGLRVYQAVAANVRRQRTPRALTVQSTKTEL